MPVQGDAGFDWQGWNPADNTADYTPVAQHPNSINQDYYTNWNNQQANGLRGGRLRTAGRAPRRPARPRVKALITSGTKVTRVNLTQAMEDAALTDLRAERVLPYCCRCSATATRTPARPPSRRS